MKKESASLSGLVARGPLRPERRGAEKSSLSSFSHEDFLQCTRDRRPAYWISGERMARTTENFANIDAAQLTLRQGCLDTAAARWRVQAAHQCGDARALKVFCQTLSDPWHDDNVLYPI